MKNNRNMPIIVLMAALISFLCLSLGVSYSYVMKSNVSATAMIITTGDLSSTIEYKASNFLLTSMDDESGLAQTDYGVITVSKDNVYTVFYTLNIGYAVDSLPAEESVGKLLPMEYIKVALFNVNGTSVSKEPIVGPVLLSDLVVSEVNGDSNFRNNYLLSFGKFNPGSDSGKYALKVWIDENTPDSYDESLIYLGINVKQETLVSKSFYTLSGQVFDKDGNLLSGEYEVSINNGNIVTTNSSGNLSVQSVPNGTYPISVKYNGVVYKSTIHIEHADNISVSSTGGSTGNSNTYIQSSAYTWYTTPGLILRSNNLSTTSNQLVPGTYTVPASYVIKAPESLSVTTIDNLKITLLENGGLTITR